MTTAAIIVAAGRGLRAGGEVAKQWQQVAGRAILDHTIDAFVRAPGVGAIVVVLHPDDMQRGVAIVAAGHHVVAGGETRLASVRNGLKILDDMSVSKVLIHDAARPCVSQQVITDVIAALITAKAAAPAIALSDALWNGADGEVTGTKDRAGLYRAQTPQGFDYAAICAAYDAYKGGASDDVQVARAAGIGVVIVPGDEDNLKVTLPGDFARAQRILETNMDIRLGNGFDVHRFGPGDHVTLCGVDVAFDRGLQGHSDADVGMHAVTDAIYGALAQGDIGQHFPPSDPQWKGADSRIFLAHAVQMAADMGFQISNVDITLICENPKIGPHAGAMRQAIAAIMEVDMQRISIKATTSERLGFTGREEGIAALATAALVAS
ncbi:MAG: bifunctional 2-C-methyl-D-erythritol 4-phosphate cytidylyltransferase/2-C-methyl-D-erythritol 2,4-cyclodiphosphate synthase [Rhodobacteraceae bacterium]|nr:MAG: bifunctional 2-C-methyl-D-erythritol 4-phosphate cytidylyltransferase/2-C-methyl-D-erythritol 2,4-cyclodiphosphate synthase [Paracoccaceae bacterium]